VSIKLSLSRSKTKTPAAAVKTKTKARLRPNRFHVMRSMDAGEAMFYPWLTLDLANKLKTVMQEIEDDRRQRSENKLLRTMPEAFDIFYVEEDKPTNRNI
jgi:hypothetical protein